MRQVGVRLRFPRLEEEGQAVVEYALVLALITLATVGMLTVMGTNVEDLLSATADFLGEVAAGL